MKELTQDWKEIKKLIVWGFGRVARDNMDYFIEHFDIACIIESDEEKCGGNYKGIPIIHKSKAQDKLQQYKVVIMTAERNAAVIGQELQRLGYEQGKDYCSMEQMVTEWFWRFQKKACLLEVHTSITTRCTLKCKNCNMFMPYYKQQYDYTVQDIDKDLEALFKNVDYLFKFVILGGEPLLNDSLADILQMIVVKYSDKIGKIGIITNGTLMPNEQLLRVSRENHIEFSISNYTNEVAYTERLNAFIEVLKQNNITYSVTENFRWCDFGFPEKNHKIQLGTVRDHMLSCGPIFHGLNDRKLFYCHVAWSADKARLHSLGKRDYVNLADGAQGTLLKKEMILKHCSATQDGAVSLCAICGGCGNDNTNFVKAAVQVK